MSSAGVFTCITRIQLFGQGQNYFQLGHVVKNQTQYQRVIKYFRCGQTVKTFLQINFLTLHSLSCDYSIYGSDTSLSGNHFISRTHLGKYL